VTTSICDPVCVSDSEFGDTVSAFGGGVGVGEGVALAVGVGVGVALAIAVALAVGVGDGVTEELESCPGGTICELQAVSTKHTAVRSCFVMMRRVYRPGVPATFRPTRCTGMGGEKRDQIDEFGEVAALLRHQVHDAAAPREHVLLV
jgi:hypothetical protein